MAAAEQVVADDVENTPEPSIREQIESARDEVIDNQVEAGAVEVKEGERARDTSGRFTRRDKGDTESAGVSDTGVDKSGVTPTKGAGRADTGKVVPAAVNAGAANQPPAATSPAVETAPQGWTPQAKAQWNLLPDWARAEISRRETETHRAITAQDEVRRLGNDFMRVANQHAPLIQARGGNPVGLFNEFLGILNNLHSGSPEQRAAMFRELAARNGVSLGGQPPAAGANGAPSPSAESQPTLHPMVQSLYQKVVAMENQQQQEQRRQRELAQQQEEAERQSITAEIMEFRSSPEHQHFETVSSLMTSLLSGGHAKDLEEAYQLAVKAHPETSKILADQAAAQAKAEAAQREKAAAARRKAGSIRGGAGNVPEATGSKGSVRDDLRAAFESVRGRV